MMRISIASDHAGFEQKAILIDYLIDKGYTVTDRGPSTDDRVDYPDFARLVAEDVQNSESDFGVLVCGTGIGMAISANKFKGVRAANVTTPEFAQLSREHNDANIVTLSGRFVDLETNKEILDAFLSTDFGNGRHLDRIMKISSFEGC